MTEFDKFVIELAHYHEYWEQVSLADRNKAAALLLDSGKRGDWWDALIEPDYTFTGPANGGEGFIEAIKNYYRADSDEVRLMWAARAALRAERNVSHYCMDYIEEQFDAEREEIKRPWYESALVGPFAEARNERG